MSNLIYRGTLTIAILALALILVLAGFAAGYQVGVRDGYILAFGEKFDVNVDSLLGH